MNKYSGEMSLGDKLASLYLDFGIACCVTAIAVPFIFMVIDFIK